MKYNIMSVIQELQSKNPISLHRLSELSELDPEECEQTLLDILDNKMVVGKYFQFEQVFSPKEIPISCEVGMEKFPTSFPIILVILVVNMYVVNVLGA